jgi:hypothetical protein
VDQPISDNFDDTLTMADTTPSGPGTSPAPEVVAPAITTKPDQPFRFLNLPTEIRLCIYEYFVVVGKVFYTPTELEKEEGSRFLDMDDYAVPSLTILRVKKQIHDEAERVYLSMNLFVLPLGFHLKQPFMPDDRVNVHDRRLFSARARQLVQNVSVAYTSLLAPGERPFACVSSVWHRQAFFEEEFEDLEERLEKVHDVAKSMIENYWDNIRATMFRTLRTSCRYFEMDFTNAYCPSGCCRMVEAACLYFTGHMWESRMDTPTLLGLRNKMEEDEAMGCIRFMMKNYWRTRLGATKLRAKPRFLDRGDKEPWAAYKINPPTTSDEEEAAIDQDGDEAAAESSDETDFEIADAWSDTDDVDATEAPNDPDDLND